jgi:glycosyltransferase involved in cell wall biosynthesis
LGKKVIFDAHEDLPQQLRSKPYLNKFLKTILPIIFEQYEKIMFKKFDALIGATPYIANKLKAFNIRVVNINNYPIIGELDEDVDWNDKENEISYIGAISYIRGIHQIVDAMQYVKTNVKLNLVGAFNTKTLLNEVKKSPGWKNVKYYGLVNRKEVSKILSRSKAGIVTFLPAPNHIYSQPNKMFEYMSVGIPIITSNFPLWKEVVEDNNCGITVVPTEPKSIAKAIDKLIENDNLAKKLGQNGKEATLNKFSWNAEENKLFRLYKDLK